MSDLEPTAAAPSGGPSLKKRVDDLKHQATSRAAFLAGKASGQVTGLRKQVNENGPAATAQQLLATGFDKVGARSVQAARTLRISADTARDHWKTRQAARTTTATPDDTTTAHA